MIKPSEMPVELPTDEDEVLEQEIFVEPPELQERLDIEQTQDTSS